MSTTPGDFSFPVTTTPISDLYLPRAFGISTLNNILNKPDVQLEDLLNEEDFPVELRDGNPRVLDYFHKNPSKVKELIDYVIKVPLNMNDTKKAYEYPLRANEVFEADINVIMNSFFTTSIVYNVKTINLDSETSSTNLKKSGFYGSLTHLGNSDLDSTEDSGSQKQTLLAYLFTFLDTKEELNPVLMGYFSKIVLKLLKRNPRKVIDLVYSNEKITTQMAYHLGEQSIAELVPPFLCYENFLYDEPRFEFIDIKIRFVQRMTDTFKNSNRPETMAHVGDLLHDILHRHETMADGKEIMNEIVSKRTLDKLFGVLSTGPSNTVISHTCNAISTILIYYASKKINFSPYGSPSSAGYSSFSSELNESPITESVTENIAALNKLLTSEKEGATLSTAYGQNIKPLGLTKLKITDIVDRILKIESNKIYAKIAETGILKTITGFFATYVWNNLLHSIYSRVVHTVLDKKSNTLNDALLVHGELIPLIIKEVKDDYCELSKSGKKARKGNTGHIHIIANEIVRVAGENKHLEEQLKKEPEWETVVLPQLKARTEVLKKDIGGYNPRTLQEELLAKILGSSPTKMNSDSPGIPKRDSISNFPLPQPTAQPFSPGLPEPQGYLSTAQPFAQSPTLSPIQNSTSETFQMGYATNHSTEPLSPYSPVEPISKESPLTSQVQPQRTYGSDLGLYDSRSEGPKSFMIEQPKKTDSSMDGFKVFKKPILEAEQINQEGSFEYGNISSPRSNDGPKGYEGTIDANGKYTSPTKHIGLFQRSYSHDIDSNTSPQRFSLARDLDDVGKDIYGTRNIGQETFAPPSTQQTPLRNSMIDLRNPTKVKLKVKPTEKFDGNKILDLLNRYKGPSTRGPAELTYSINSVSESGLLSDDDFAAPGDRAVRSLPVLLDDYN